MISGAILMLTGFIITIIFKNRFAGAGMPQYIGAAFGAIGVILWFFGKEKTQNE